jgi:hypothetical protein
MRRAAIALLLLTPLASAQFVVPAGELDVVRRNFESRPGDEPLRCDVTPLAPSLNFAFRFQAGYTFHVPQTWYPSSTRGWLVLTAITPERGEATYLLARTRLSEALRVGLDFDVRGAYFLGVGRYSVESTLLDGRNRVCRKQWQIVVGPARAIRAIPFALPPDTVRPFTPAVSPDTQHQDSTAPMHLSVLLNAAAFSTLRTVIRPYDRGVLLGALTALLEHLPATSVRLVVFSLEQQREVFRSESFAPPGVDKAADAIRSLQLATVDVQVLQKPLGHVDFLARLIARERDEPNPADTIVFLGPTSRYGDKIPEGVLPTPAEGSPHFFYLRYESPHRPVFAPAAIPVVPTADPGLGGGSTSPPPPLNGPAPQNAAGGPHPPVPGQNSTAGGPGRVGGGGGAPAATSQAAEGQTDVIAAAVGRMKGKTLTIHTPADLAKAIRRIEGRR